MSRSTKPSKTSIGNILQEAKWDPRKPGLQALQAGMSPEYLRDHAAILLAQSKMERCKEREMLLQAMGLIALAINKMDSA